MKAKMFIPLTVFFLSLSLFAYAQPNAPSGLTATATSTTAINLTWTDNSTNETGFQVERSLSAGSGFALISTRAANSVSFSNTGLTVGVTYYYRIRAINGALTSAYTTVVTATTILATPTGLTAITASGTSINLSWVDNSINETGYQIERSLAAASGFALITTVAANAVTYSDGSLVNGTRYYYRVRATNAGNNSAYSAVANAITTSPTGLIATAASSSSVSLTWTDNSSTETGFQIERSLLPASGFALIATMVPNATQYADVGLSPSTNYYYRLRALIPTGNSPYTLVANATTIASPPLAPSTLTTTVASSSAINLAWTDNSNNETGFQIERSLTTSTGFSLVGTAAANAVSYADASLVEGTAYFYRIRAINGGGSSSYTSESTATTNTSPPIAPINLVAEAVSASTINLEWVDLATNETGYEIERSLTTGTGFSLIGTTAAEAFSYESGGLNPTTTYFYRVRAVNIGGSSAYTSEASATTTEATPAIPASFTATPSSTTSINLTWTDASTDETGFQIERSLISTGNFVLIATAPINAVSYADIALTPETKYYYRIRAINGPANSAYTAGNATTPPSIPLAPSSLTATATSPTSVVLSWVDASANETGFQIERSITAGSGYTVVATTSANTVSFSDINLSSGSTYYYRIRAVNGGGNSTFTSEVSALLTIAGATPLCANIFCNSNGGVGIGTQVVPAGYALSIKGKMMAEGVKVALRANWPDYVFQEGYELKDIDELKTYIEAHGHLPNVPTAEMVKEDGIDLEEINILLLEKIEEMSLYLIQMEERMNSLEEENKKLMKKESNK